MCNSPCIWSFRAERGKPKPTTSRLEQDALLDERLRGCMDPRDIMGEYGLLDSSQTRLVGYALEVGLNPSAWETGSTVGTVAA